jgi:hypothetical protein
VSNVRIRTVVLGVVAALTTLALAASSASALPEFGQCFVQAKHEGKYANSVCTAKAKVVETKNTGEFEWRKATEMSAANKKLTGIGGKVGLTFLERVCEPSGNVRAAKCATGEEEVTVGPIPPNHFVECSSESNQGEITGPNVLKNIQVTFTGCLGPFGKCKTTGAAEGEVRLNGLKGKIGYVNKVAVPRQAGLVLEPALAKGKVLTMICGANAFGVAIGMGNETEGCVYPQKACGGDGVVSAITPVNTMTTELTQTFAVNEATAENVPSKLEGTQPLKELEGFAFSPNPEFPGTSMWSKIAESLTNSDTAPEALEIKAN